MDEFCVSEWNYQPLPGREGPAFVAVTTPEGEVGDVKLWMESPQDLSPDRTCRKCWLTCSEMVPETPCIPSNVERIAGSSTLIQVGMENQ
jgi:hypothetical protein